MDFVNNVFECQRERSFTVSALVCWVNGTISIMAWKDKAV